MLLAIDIGNTNIVIGFLEGREARRVFRLQTVASRTEDEFVIALAQVLSLAPGAAFDGAIVSSVVPPLTAAARNAVRRVAGLDAFVVGAGMRTGLPLRIDDPASLGADLVATGAAAAELYEPPVIVVDMGTATTIGVLDKDRNYIGGAIFPGLALSMDALSRGTSQLPRVPLEAPPRAICANTVDCMKSGAVFGTAAMIDGMAARFEEQLGMPCRVVVTGGLSRVVAPHCRHPVTYNEDLLLQGLAILHEKNEKARKG
jgi:type III pantothenate kinase